MLKTSIPQTLYYSILKQTQIEDIDDLNEEKQPQLNQLVVNQLFQIENTTGIVYINLNKYKLLKKFSQHLHQSKTSKLKQQVMFSLQLAVTDSMLTSHSRLTVQIESLISKEQLNWRPMFKSSLIN